jgi:hypothetical protein
MLVHDIYYCVVHWNEGRYTCKACTRTCIWYVGVHVCMDVYDLALGCMYGIAHRELAGRAIHSWRLLYDLHHLE